MIFGDDIDTFIDFAVAFGAFLGEIEWHGCVHYYMYSQFLQESLCSVVHATNKRIFEAPAQPF
jgi:hypothetical protein